ncbi:MAG: hypothetical protein MJ052_03690, partial [Sphaerochaetaceae bacterium]|nr:hypothetical protein [Sphaerochaetaceae bacterium]
FQIQEIPGDSVPYGLKTCLKAVRTWMRGLSPEQGCDDSGHLEKLKQGLCEGRYFEKWIQRNLLDNSRRCLLTVTTDTGYEEKTKACLSALLRKKTESGNRAEYKKQLVEYERFAAEDDSPEALSCIPRIRVSDIPENIPSFDAMPSEIEGCRTVLTELFTRGISYLNLSFGTSVLEDEEKPFAALLVRLMQMCGTEKHDYTQISNMINFFTGSFTMSISASADVIGNRVGEVSVRTKMLDRDVPQALDVIAELLGGCILTSAERIQTAITDMLTEFDSNYLDSASSYASLYAGSVLSPSMLDNDYFKGTGCWFAIRKIKDFYANNYEDLSGILTNIHSKLFSVSNMRIYAGCDSDFTDELRQHLARFVRTLNKVCRAQKAVLTVPEKMYVRRLSDINFLTVSSGPAYNVSAVPVEIRNEHERVSFMLLGSLLGSGFLWDNIRGRNGAYGVESHLNLQESIFFMSTYRDPKIRETFELFEKSLETVISDAEIEYAIVTVLGRELKPLSPQLRCAEIYRRDLLGLSDALYLERRTEMLKVSASDIRNAASVLSEAIRKRCIKVSVCSSSSVAENFLQGAETTELPL